jgi:hypothetical protein
MCPDYQILSVYLDGELPSPWKEKMEGHLAQCEKCREKLAAYRLTDGSPELAPAALAQVRERVWQRLQDAGTGRKYSHIIENRPLGNTVFWRRNIPIPFPAIAAAAILVIAMTFLWIRRPVENAVQDTAIAASEELDMRGMAPLTDIRGVLQYLSNNDSSDYVILRLPESRNFISSGEPAIIKAADYSRRNPQR